MLSLQKLHDLSLYSIEIITVSIEIIWICQSYILKEVTFKTPTIKAKLVCFFAYCGRKNVYHHHLIQNYKEWAGIIRLEKQVKSKFGLFRSASA